MKKRLLLITALLYTMTAWATDYNVGTDAELRAAIENDGANITVTADIELSNSTLSIPEGTTVTINLGGHTLDRKLTKRGEGGGQVITVRNGATLILSNGTLTGGWGGNGGGLANEAGGTANLENVNITGNTADDRGGGISNHGTLTMTGGSISGNISKDGTLPAGGGAVFNYEGATATLSGVTITGNEAKIYGGGGVDNWGTLTLDGCTIQNNTSKEYGAGVWSSKGSTLNMQGKNTITGNTGKGVADNVYLTEGTVINVTGALTASSIGINMESTTGIFTNDYNAHNSDAEPSQYFTPDDDVFYDVTLSENEACLSPADLIYPVKTGSDLLRAVGIDNANIRLGGDINITQILGIPEKHTVTLDLNGFTLDHLGTYRNGQAIVVEKGATLNLSNGTVTRGWGGDGGGLENKGTANLTDVIISKCHADDRGGGISNHGTLTMTGGSITGNESYDKTGPSGGGGLFNYEGATATLTGVSLSGNKATGTGGGGICNCGTLTIDGCTITDNTAGTEGGGIWNDKDATLNIQGETTIMVNTANSGMINNVFLKADAVINVTGALAGSQIGVTMGTPGTFTGNFSASGVADPTHVFLPDLPSDIMAVGLEGGEAKLYSVLPEGTVYFVSRYWDNKKSKVTGSISYLTEQIDFDAIPTNNTQYKLLTSSDNNVVNIGVVDDEVTPEYYVVIGNVEVNELYVKGSSVHIILCDNAKLTMHGNITVHKDHHVAIHDQGSFENMGQLRGDSTSIGGVGGDNVTFGGDITIYGGHINVKAPNLSSAIGGNYTEHIGDIEILGGNIRAEGGKDGAGIGGGHKNSNFGDIHIYGGIINAIGGDIMYVVNPGSGAGIGGGSNSYDGNVYIYGGYITATTNGESAGIGSSQLASAWVSIGSFFINGGVVRAYGGTHGAGIGGGDGMNGGSVYIRGGHVEAYGGDDAAGIGGGEGGNGLIVKISGGYVYAKGGWEYGAGIGGGQDGKAADVEITDAVVIAEAGLDETGCRAIGPGSGCDDYGTLRLDSKLMVTSERIFTAPERKNGCWYRTRVRVEPCYHPDATYTVSGTGPDDTHLKHCDYCTVTFNEEKHKFVDGVCTVCGVSETAYSVNIYLPVVNGSEGQYDAPEVYQVVENSSYTLPVPPEDKTPTGLEFAGWLAATPDGLTSYVAQPDETLLDAGSQYSVKDNVSFTARYQSTSVILADGKYNGETIHRYDGKKVASVTLDGRTFSLDGTWNTICLPFSVGELTGTPLEGATLMTLGNSDACCTGFDTETGTLDLEFVPANSIEPGVAYIMKWETPNTDIVNPVFKDVTIQNESPGSHGIVSQDGTVAFYGTFNPRNFYGESKTLLYFGTDNEVYYPTEAMTIGALRSFFRLTGLNLPEKPTVQNIVLHFGDEPTGISSVESSRLNGDNWYDLSGRQLNGKPTRKGVYINSGKKVVIE